MQADRLENTSGWYRKAILLFRGDDQTQPQVNPVPGVLIGEACDAVEPVLQREFEVSRNAHLHPILRFAIAGIHPPLQAYIGS